MPPPYSAGSIFLQVVPSFRGVPEQIAREAREWGEAAGKDFDTSFEKHAVDAAKATGKKVGKAISDEVTGEAKTAAQRFSDIFERETRTKKLFQHVERDADAAGKKAAQAMGSHFDETVRKLQRSLASKVATIKINADDKQAQQTFRQLQRDIALLDAQAEIGMDINPGTTMQVIGRVNAALAELQDTAGDIKARVDFANVYSEGAKVEAYLHGLSSINIEPELKIEKQMGAFERGIRGAIDGALRDLGTVDNGVASSAGQRSVAHLRKRLLDLGDLEIGVDISAESAREELADIRDDLEQIQREHWSVDLDANTAAAASSINGILAALEVIDHTEATAEVEIKGVQSAIANAYALDAALDRVENKIDGTSSSAQEGANAFRAFNIRILGVAALGPLVVPALGGIAAGIGALLPLAAAAGAGLGVLTLGLWGIGDAFKAMGDAQASAATDAADYQRTVRDSARAVEDAERGVADARRSAAQASEAASRRVENAVEGVADAERGLAQAHADVERAQQDVTRAREEAAEQLEDLRLQIRGGTLDERQAVLDLREAEKELREGRNDGASGDDLAQLILNLDKAKLRLDQTREANGDLREEQERWARSGVEGSEQVIAAQERVARAQDGVRDAERRMADAQEDLADARADSARVAADGQRQIADAQRTLADAQLAYSEAVFTTSTSQKKLNEEMAKLGPAGREFVRYLDSLRPKFQQFRTLAQGGLLPGLTDWIDSMVTYHGPLLESTIEGMSGAIGGMFSQFADSIRGPQFTELFQMIDRSGPIFLSQMGRILVNLGEGIASLIVAMEPLAHIFGEWLTQATQRFSDWAASLRGSDGLQSFFEWIQRVGPKIADFFWELGDALIAIGIAIAPFAERLLENFTVFFDWISELDPNVLGNIVVGIAGVTVALQVIFGLTALAISFKSALDLVKGALGRLSGTGPGGLAGVGKQAGLFAAALVTLYTQSELVRDVFDGIVDALARFVGWITGSIPDIAELAGTIALVAASWKAASFIAPGFGKLGGAAQKAAPHVGLMVSGITGSNRAAGAASTTMGKLGGALTKIGGALPIIGLGFGLVAAGIEASNRAAQENRDRLLGWIQDTHAGGEKAREAAKKLGEYEDKIRTAQAGLDSYNESMANGTNIAGDYTGAVSMQESEIEELEKALADSEKEWEEYWKGLTPVEQAQARVLQTQNDLTSAIEEHGRTSDEAKVASDAYKAAQERLEQIQIDVATATSGLNVELHEQLGLMMELAEAELAYEQSASALEDAHTRSAEALAEYGANSKEYRDALLAEEAASDAVADAAARVAEKRHQDADATTRQAYGQAAYYWELERQKELYGELPPRLEAVRADMERLIDPAILAAAGFEDLGLEISNVPDRKTIIVESLTDDARQRLEDLGFVVEEMPDGSFKVTADTEEAAAALDALTAPRTIEITAAVRRANAVDRARNAPENYGDAGFGNAGYASGGPVWGPGSWTSDSIPAYLSNGEYVIQAASVHKYGLGFLDAVNAGQWAPGVGFNQGGLASQPSWKRGRRAFAAGGYAASYSGQINMSGLAVPELATFWVDAVTTISAASGRAATVIGRIFASLRQALLGNFGDTSSRTKTIWGELFGFLEGRTTTGTGVLTGLFGRIQDYIAARTGETSTNTRATWSSMLGSLERGTSSTTGVLTGLFGRIRDWAAARSSETNSRVSTSFASMRTNITARTTESRDTANRRFGEMRDGMSRASSAAVSTVVRNFGGMPRSVASPIDRIIDKVLNNGLFKAFNSVVGSLGLDSKLRIPTAGKIRLATGGRVPGWSPNDKADNIPAMLTAGEWVQPVSTVQYYGPEIMEALRKRQIPREAFGIRRAEGGPVGWQAMARMVQGQFPWARITSAYRPGDPGYHGKGLAVDIGGRRPYPDPQGMRDMLQINRWIAGNFANITELIHTASGAINLWHGKRHTYNAGTRAAHRNHVHWAQAGGIRPGNNLIGLAFDAITDPSSMFAGIVDDALGKSFGSSPMHRILTAGSKKMAELMATKAASFMSNLFGADDAQFSTGKLGGATSGNEALVRNMAAARGWTGGEWNALRTLIMKESGFRNTAQNPTSTAYGMFQFLNSTWGTVGARKTSDPRAQTEAGFRYIAQRYGTPSRALAFHNRNNWYSEGGPVQDVDSASGAVIPDLHDTGGWVMPGLNVIMNRTGRPEPTINPQTLDALQQIAAGGGGNSGPFRDLNIGVASQDPYALADVVMHQVHSYDRGGRYHGPED